MAKLKPFRENYYLWHYVPSTAAAVLFVVLFSLASSLIIWRIVKTRNWYCIPFVVGGLCKYFSSPCPKDSMLIHKLQKSRNNRIHSPSHGREQNGPLTTLCRPEHLHPPRPCILRRNDIHGPRPPHAPSQGRTTLHPPGTMAHGGLCWRRHYIVLHHGQRRGRHGLRKRNDGHGSKDHHRRLLSPNPHDDSVHNHSNHVPCGNATLAIWTVVESALELADEHEDAVCCKCVDYGAVVVSSGRVYPWSGGVPVTA